MLERMAASAAAPELPEFGYWWMMKKSGMTPLALAAASTSVGQLL
jgi:hypothetical protein